MSTTFGIPQNGKDIILENDCLPNEYESEEFIEVAFRSNYNNFIWKNEIAKFLPKDLKVYPLDNTAQGIYTIGDILNEMKEQL